MEQLQYEKTRLEQESHALDEELKQLDARWKILDEKVAIQELKNENATKKATISQLESKIGLLETRLGKLTMVDALKKEAPATNKNAENQETAKEVSEASGEQEKAEETIMVTAFNGEEEINENFETEQEKEKHELFF